MIVLRPYQDKAVSDLYSATTYLLQKAGNKVIVLKAPTGSGKTIMMAEFLRKLVSENTTGFLLSFIWAAPRQLHIQSQGKLEHYYYGNKALKCSFFEDLVDKNIDENEILFLNWESINKKDNIYIRENENDFNLSSVLQNTRDQGRQVILIIDESHFSTNTEIASGLKDMINPKLTIEVSATPVFRGDELDQLVSVDREDVIHDEMIKKYVVINQEFKNDILAKSTNEISVKPQETTNEFIISEALKKREQLTKEFASLSSNVNPLMLIQLPDRSPHTGDLKGETIAILKNKHDITVENGKLAIYLSEDKQNLDTISINDDKVDVMIFKQAIAIGWDCPRAHILLMLREMRSFVFTVQTVGRILRMPELKHYASDALNIGYIYTNMPTFSIQGEESFGYIIINSAKCKDIYIDINLPSVHSKRFREETRLSPHFISCFWTASGELKLKDNIDLDVKEISKTLVSDVKVEDIDKGAFAKTKEIGAGYITDKGDQVYLVQQETEIQHDFELFIVESLKPLFPESRSIDRMKQAIYSFFKKTYPKEYKSIETKMQLIVLKNSNTQHFVDVINKAKELYFASVGKGKSELVSDADWNVSPYSNYPDNYSNLPAKLCIVEPFYQRNDASQVEKDFANYLESKTDEIEWWYKNGENDAKHFAIPYDDKGTNRAFYIDWIVKYKNGKLALFDTKSGITAETAKSKAEGLYKYIKEQNSKGKNLFGGIVIKKDGSWRYNDNEIYEYDENNLKSWKYLA
jgi:type III restriction enzyme